MYIESTNQEDWRQQNMNSTADFGYYYTTTSSVIESVLPEHPLIERTDSENYTKKKENPQSNSCWF